MLEYFLKRFQRIIKPSERKKRKQFFQSLVDRFDDTVAYGPFKGLKFSPQSWWSKNDRPSMLFGIYEQEVLKSIFTKPETCRTLIDIGAADGYYPVGCLLSGQFDAAYAFEISELGQKCIADLAKANHVDQQVKIFGQATEENLISLLQSLPPSMVLIDIEGAEFALLTEQTIEALKRHFVIIEMHDFMMPNGETELQLLHGKLDKYFTIAKFTTADRDLSQFIELHSCSDSERWSICSERRARLMWWWRLNPKDN